MNLPLQTIALVEMALACSAAAIWILQKLSQREFSFITKAILLLAMANLLFWPLGMSLDLPLAAYVRGVVGDLSIVTLLLLLSSLFLNQRQAPAGFKLGIVVVGFAFYPFALGFTMFDPYAWGYGSILDCSPAVCHCLRVGKLNSRSVDDCFCDYCLGYFLA
jgi:hypothetical protein